MYDENLIAPMRAELTSHGISEVRTASEVQELADGQGTALFFINSVCGCAARSARPGLLKALQDAGLRPSVVATAFAGNDVEAVQRIRSLASEVPPSSPSAALFRNGKPVYFIQRHQIEGRNPVEVAALFTAGFQKFCGDAVVEDVPEPQLEGAGTHGKDRCYC